MKKIFYIITAFTFITFWYSCQQQGRIDFVDHNAPPPALVSDVKASSEPGGAIITYKVPKDPNLYYVKAVYEIQPGIFRTAQSSYYTDTLELVGYGDTLSHAVKIYSVGKNEKESAPINIDIRPSTPPVMSVLKTATLSPTFGGVTFNFQHNPKADLAYTLLVDSTGQGDWSTLNTFYTAAVKGSFSIYGLDTMRKKFGLFITDHWDNRSDTLVKSFSPLYEELIDRTLITPVVLPNDAPLLSVNNGVDKLFDGTINTGSFASPNGTPLPQAGTFDFHQKVRISRFKEFQRLGKQFSYGLDAVKKFELWGSNTLDKSGNWASWQLLGTFDSYKPSGLPLGQVSDEDYQYASIDGEDFTMPQPVPAVRYVRINVLELWQGSGQIAINEMIFWGQVEP
jgi:hypothetical protein